MSTRSPGPTARVLVSSFTSPVPVGSRVRARFTLLKFEKIEGDGVQVTWNATVDIEGKDKPALVAEWLGRHYY